MSLALLLHNVGCDFPHPTKIDNLTYLRETEGPNDLVYLYDIY